MTCLQVRVDREEERRLRQIERERRLTASKREAKIAGLSKEWSAALSEWERESPHSPARGAKLTKLTRYGVPPSMRARVWKSLLGNRMHVNASLYEIFSGHARAARESLEAAAAVEAERWRSATPASRGDGSVGAGGPSSVASGGAGGAVDSPGRTDGASPTTPEAPRGSGVDGDTGMSTAAVQEGEASPQQDGGDTESTAPPPDGSVAARAPGAARQGGEDGRPTTPRSGTSTASVDLSVGSSDRFRAAVDAGAYVATLDGNEGSVATIERDVPRTFPELMFFSRGGPMYTKLRSVLEAYAFYRPDIGYKQGMSHIAAVFFLVFDSEAESFIALANMLARTPMHFVVSGNMEMLQQWFDVFQRVLQREMPPVAAHFEEIGLSPQFFLMGWLVTLFTKALPLDMALQVWDRFFVEQHPFLVRVSVAILQCMAKELLTMPMETAVRALVRVPETVTEPRLRKAIDSVKLTKEEIKALRRLGED